MRVDNITLPNFKCFEERTFRLKSRFNLVVGTNGKGKTSLIDGLAVGLGSVEMCQEMRLYSVSTAKLVTI